MEMELVQISLVIRALTYAALFTFAAFVVHRSNPKHYISVTLFALFLLAAGIFNLIMMIQWIALFYI